MDAIAPVWANIAIEAGWDMRVGRKLKRTLYLSRAPEDELEFCVGIVDSESIAAQIVALWNDNAAAVRAGYEEGTGYRPPVLHDK